MPYIDAEGIHMTDIPERFPKVESPYHRSENDDGDYVVDPDGQFIGTKQKFEWVTHRADEVEAIEKLDGTNMAVYVEHKHGDFAVTKAATRMGNKRMNEVLPLGPKTNHHYITRAIQNSIRRGYIYNVATEYGEGWFFGEAVGPKFQGNPHALKEHLFVPFDWVRDKLEYKSYGDYPTNFGAIRDWFRGEENGLFSLFASRMHGQDLASSRPQNGTFVEGIMFLHPEFDGQIKPADLTTDDNDRINEMAKLRRDMHDGFQKDEWPMTEWGH
jgi:hypothetical protein